jgi:hypothetical protein
MKKESASLFLTISNHVIVGPIEIDVLTQILIYEHEGKIRHDVEVIDYSNATFAGVEIKEWKKFINFHKAMGIDFEQQIDESLKKDIDGKVNMMVQQMSQQSLETILKLN